MTRLFYRIEDKMFFDQVAFMEMTKDYLRGIDDIGNIFGVGSTACKPRFIKV